MDLTMAYNLRTQVLLQKDSVPDYNNVVIPNLGVATNTDRTFSSRVLLRTFEFRDRYAGMTGIANNWALEVVRLHALVLPAEPLSIASNKVDMALGSDMSLKSSVNVNMAFTGEVSAANFVRL